MCGSVPTGEAGLHTDRANGLSSAFTPRRTLDPWDVADGRGRPRGRCVGPGRGRTGWRGLSARGEQSVSSVYYALGVVIFFGSILTSIGLHELGHMIPAKAFGGKVTQYFIGFGPTVWSRQKCETEYGVKAIPLGGYVKIVGMLPPDKEHAGKVEYDADGNRVLTVRRSNTGLFAQLVSDARAAEWETITAADEHRLFYRMTWWKKVVVMAGGPTVNLLIAFFIFAGLFATYGNPSDEILHTRVGDVSACVIPATR